MASPSGADIAILVKLRDEASKEADSVGKSLRGIDKDAKDAGDSAEKATGAFGKMGPALLAVSGGAVAIGGIAVAAKGFVSAASDMNETLSKSNTIFGSNAGAIEKWASGAARDFGQSKQGALDAASTFGNLFTQLGISTEQAAAMSTQMVELASDFASFHNANPAEVIEAQTAAFRGEYDALQRFVPTINAAAVEQKALAMTGKTLTAELTAQEKALATQALMMEGAGAAAGDFDRTSSGLANSTRTLSAMWADAQVTLGNLLLPALTAVALFIVNTLIPGIEKLVQHPGVQEFAAKVEAEFAKFPGYYENNIKPALDNVIAAFEAISPIVIPILVGIGNQMLILADVIGSAIAIVVALLAGDWAGAWEAAKSLVFAIWDGIMNQIQTIVNVIVGILDVFGVDVGAIWENIRSTITGIVDGIRSAVEGAFSGMVSTVVGMFNGLINRINGVIGRINSALNFTVSFPGIDPPGPGSIPGFSQSINAGNVPTIPNMALGGIVNPRPGGTVVRVAEAGYPEAIVPLNGNGGPMYGAHYGTIQLVAPNIRTFSDLMPGVDFGGAA